MKESVLSGKQIYTEISRLQAEVDEFDKAAGSVEDELGTDSTAYRMLVKAKHEKQEELDKLFNQRFTHFKVDMPDFEWRG